MSQIRAPAQGASDWRLVPVEPTIEQHIAAMEFALAHMKAHNVTSLSPFKDYPPLRETTAGMYRAMVGAAPACSTPAEGGTELSNLRRDVIELREWKAAIIGKCRASDGFDALAWGGDKEGWGFIHYFIGHLETRALQAEAQVEKARKQAFIEAMDELDKMRTLAATDFKSPNCQGQRGMDRTDAFYDAYHAIRRLSDTSTIREADHG